MTAPEEEEKRPTPKEVWTAIEQPGEEMPETRVFLDKHPALEDMLKRQRKLELEAEEFGKATGMSPEEFGKYLDEMVRRRLRERDQDSGPAF